MLSAKYGLVSPEQVLEPYNQTLTDASRAERRAWSERILAELTAELGDLSGIAFQVHAGAAYLNFGLIDGLLSAGSVVEDPVAGLRVGERLFFYKTRDASESRAA